MIFKELENVEVQTDFELSLPSTINKKVQTSKTLLVLIIFVKEMLNNIYLFLTIVRISNLFQLTHVKMNHLT